MLGPRSVLRRVVLGIALVGAGVVGAGVDGASLAPSLAAPAFAQAPPDPALVERGAYLAIAGNCAGCHTAAAAGSPELAGGRPLKTPFGILHAPNITPDRDHGLGGWTEAQFIRAMREGIAPDGTSYYPAFPFTSYTKMTDSDIRALWAWLRTIPANAQANRPQELRFPFNYRTLLLPWRALFFRDERFTPDPIASAAWNRGAYIANALGHCGECHTERNRLGATRPSRAYAGSLDNAEGEGVPNVTPHPDGLAEWTESDIAWYLEAGTTPDYEPAGGLMAEVIRGSTRRLTSDDRKAIATYLKSLPPLPAPRKPGA